VSKSAFIGISPLSKCFLNLVDGIFLLDLNIPVFFILIGGLFLALANDEQS
jgi:hypothetical protein